MIPARPVLVRRRLPWRDPLAVAAALKDRPGALALMSDPGEPGGRSWIGAEPDVLMECGGSALFASLGSGDALRGVVGLAAYDAGARPATGERGGDWPDLVLARYPALLRFDHAAREAVALGLGRTPDEAGAEADRAAAWWAQADDAGPVPPAPAPAMTPEAPDDAYVAAVADVVARIGAGELFQANIARAWTGALEADTDPFAVFRRLAAGRASAFGAWWRMGDRALVSNSPELFLTFDPADRRLETRPIKGTRPRDPDPQRDARLARDLAASAKDRAENLMIVDLMRNDLSRVAEPGSVRVERLFEVQTLPTVHHLVSTVTGRARRGMGPADVLDAAFPPGSITGAPKHQAMKVIARHEPPRGPWCGSLFVIDDDGALTASVLIRTAAFTRRDRRWSFRTLAGAGIVADSDPVSELAETEAKIRALREALTGDQGV